MELPDVDFVKNTDTKIPVRPSPDYLKNLPKPTIRKNVKEDHDFSKHARSYDAYCRWAALPKAARNPKTAILFEKKWRVPKGYTGAFRNREDFIEKTTRYHFDWVMDNWPDVMDAIYKRAVRNSSADAKMYAEIVAKHIDFGKPQNVVQPFILVGVDQSRINELFVPRDYQKLEPINQEGGE